MPLASSLQAPLEEVFARHLAKALRTSRKLKSGDASEVDWIERLHEGCAFDLEVDLRAVLRGESLSVAVQSALVHGSPFQILPRWSQEGGIEIGDLMLVGQQHDKRGALIKREALLLQMKVGQPRLRNPPRRHDSISRQAYFFASWPYFCWRFRAMRQSVPQPPCRQPEERPREAAQFGIIGSGSHRALRLDGPGRFAPSTPLARELARVVRLDLGVDATPVTSSAPDFGWPRIVQDILDRAPGERFHGISRGVSTEPTGGRAFLAVTVASAPTGTLD